MGIVFQIYLCIPWININGKYNTIHMYLIKAFRQNDYVDIYIQTFLKIIHGRNSIQEWQH